MTATHLPVDVFMRHTGRDGKSYVMCHRAWDRRLFVLSSADAARKAGGSAEPITEAQYQTERAK